MGCYELSSQLYDQEAHTVHISEDVRISGKLTKDLIAESVAFLHKDGIIVLENAIDVSHLDILHEKLSREAFEIANDPDHHFNFGKETRNMDQAPPPTKDLMFKDVWCNPFAAAVLSNILGPRPVIHYANGNTALKATARQPVHSDCEWAHPVYFPFAYTININLVDTSPENGSTEIWPGSHHISSQETHPKPRDRDDHMLVIQSKLVEERRKHSPPIQPRTKKGSIIIRDLRLWHAGMPNRTNEPRVMLAFVAQPSWFQGRSQILLPKNVKAMVESWAQDENGYGFEYDAEYIDGEVDHKKLNSSNVDFDSKSQILDRYRPVLCRWPDYVPRWY